MLVSSSARVFFTHVHPGYGPPKGVSIHCITPQGNEKGLRISTLWAIPKLWEATLLRKGMQDYYTKSIIDVENGSLVLWTSAEDKPNFLGSSSGVLKIPR